MRMEKLTPQCETEAPMNGRQVQSIACFMICSTVCSRACSTATLHGELNAERTKFDAYRETELKRLHDMQVHAAECNSAAAIAATVSASVSAMVSATVSAIVRAIVRAIVISRDSHRPFTDVMHRHAHACSHTCTH